MELKDKNSLYSVAVIALLLIAVIIFVNPLEETRTGKAFGVLETDLFGDLSEDEDAWRISFFIYNIFEENYQTNLDNIDYCISFENEIFMRHVSYKYNIEDENNYLTTYPICGDQDFRINIYDLSFIEENECVKQYLSVNTNELEDLVECEDELIDFALNFEEYNGENLFLLTNDLVTSESIQETKNHNVDSNNCFFINSIIENSNLNIEYPQFCEDKFFKECYSETDDGVNLGFDYFTKGSVEALTYFDEVKTFEDYCLDGYTLIEYGCDEHLATPGYSESYECPYGCLNGACVGSGEYDSTQKYIKGRLIDIYSGDPIVNVPIEQIDNENGWQIMHQTQTDENGYFRIAVPYFSSGYYLYFYPDCYEEGGIIGEEINGELKYYLYTPNNYCNEKYHTIKTNVVDLGDIELVPAVDIEYSSDVPTDFAVYQKSYYCDYDIGGAGSSLKETEHYFSNIILQGYENRIILNEFSDNQIESEYHYVPIQEGCYKINVDYIDGEFIWSELKDKYSEVEEQDRLSFDLELNEGWNLISIPLYFQDNRVESVFADELNNIETIYTYRNNEWKIWSNDAPSNIEGINPGQAYFVKAKGSSFSTKYGYNYVIEENIPPTPITLKLYPGWNLIGPIKKGEYEEYISNYDFLSNVEDSVTSVWGYDNTLENYNLNSYFDFEVGKGYWIYATKEGEIPS